MNGQAILNKLTTEDVCLILNACATNKVSKLQFGELIVEFGTASAESHQKLPALTQAQHDENNKAQVQKDAAALRRQELDELLITDPETYEELLQKGELIDVNGE